MSLRACCPLSQGAESFIEAHLQRVRLLRAQGRQVFPQPPARISFETKGRGSGLLITVEYPELFFWGLLSSSQAIRGADIVVHFRLLGGWCFC